MINNKVSEGNIKLLLVISSTFFFNPDGFCKEKKVKNKERPNVIMITCHDIGQHIGCYGVKTVETPNIDNLARQGIMFQNSYSTSAVSSPGRAGLHTGRYPQSNGVMGLIHKPWDWELNEDVKVTPQILGERGYQTFLIGFNHIALNKARLGYDSIPKVGDNANVAETAVKIIDKMKSGSQYFIKVGFTLIHRPFKFEPDSSKGIFVPPYLANTPVMRLDLAKQQAAIKYFDQLVGKIIKAVRNSDVAKNTLIVFTSDHGIAYPGSKWSLRRAGIQIPFILYQPKTIFSGGKKYSDVFSNIDFLPTLLSYLNLDKPEYLQGMDFIPFISGKEKKGPRKYAFAQYTTDMKRDNVSRCVITEDYHLIRYFDQGRAVKLPINISPQRFASHIEREPTNGHRPWGELFNIKEDPYELNSIEQDENNKEKINELTVELLKWMKDVDDQLLKGPERTPSYDKAINDFLQYDKK